MPVFFWKTLQHRIILKVFENDMKEQRMCTIALRHLSGIQKGIQSAHAIVEFENKYGQSRLSNAYAAYSKWARRDKTLIVLEAHSDSDLNEAYAELSALKIPVAKFREPDLGNTTTAIAFVFSPKVDDEASFGTAFIKERFRLATN